MSRQTILDKVGAPATEFVDAPEAPEVEPDVKPRSRRSRKTETPKKIPTFRAGQISKFAADIYRAAGGTLTAMGRETYGAQLIAIAEPAGAVWEKLARRHEWLRRFFDKIMTGSEFSELFWVHFPLFVLVLNDLGILNPQNFAREVADELREEMADNAA